MSRHTKTKFHDSNATAISIPPSKENETMLQWFKNQTNDKPLKNAIEMISVLNARSLIYESLNRNEQKKMRKEIIELGHYISDKYQNNDKFWTKINQNWAGEMPRILRMAEYFIEEAWIKEHEQLYDSLPETQRKNTDMLYRYIWHIRQNRFLTFTFSDNSCSILELPRTIYREELDTLRKILKGYLTEFINQDSSIIFRYVCPDDRKKFIINGFRNSNGIIETLDRTELKYCMELQPDGTMEPMDDEIYDVAPLIFAKT